MGQNKLFNVEVYVGKIKKSTEAIRVTYAIAQMKRKKLIAAGTYPRQIWIVPAA